MRSPSPFRLETRAFGAEVIELESPAQTPSPFTSRDVVMIDCTPHDPDVEVAMDSETRSLSLLCHLRSLPWLHLSRTLKGCLSSVQNVSIFNSAEDIVIPLYLVPSSLAAYSEYETGLPETQLSVKGLLNAAADSAMIQSFDIFHYMSTTIYLLSNRLGLMEGEALTCVLETLSDRIPRNLLHEILKTPLPAVRAAWEILIRFDELRSFDGFFDLLVDVGIENDWLNVKRMGHDYLFYAIRVRCFDAMKQLLARGCRADSGWLHEKDSALLKAIQDGEFAAAKLLLRYCDVNRSFYFYRDPSTVGQSTNFLMFMYQYDANDPKHRRGLKLFFENGAKSDAPWFDSPFQPRRNPAMLDFYRLNNISLKWWPTILDYYFYADPSTYDRMRRYDKGNRNSSSAARSRRSDILLALEEDRIRRVESLLSSIDKEIEKDRQEDPTCTQHFPYLIPPTSYNGGRQKDWERHPFLELLLVEQFLFGGVWYEGKLLIRNITWELISLHVDLNIPSLPNTDMTELLCAALALIRTDSGMALGIQRRLEAFVSLHQDSINWSKVFLVVVQINHPEGFRLVSEKAPDPGKNGEAALIEAAQLHNYQAIDWLLGLGVNIGALATFEGHATQADGPIASVHNRISKAHPRYALSTPMVNFLRTKGLHLEPKVENFDPSQRLKGLFQHGSTETLQKTEYLLEKRRHLKGDQPDSKLSAYLLELCLRGPDPWKERQQRLEVFECCFNHGADISPNSPLAVLIYAGGRTELIQELLARGAEVNAYSHDMELEFPKLSEPWSLTPLQAAAFCGNEAIVNDLLERGADVNAPALGRLGKTALQNICAWMPGTPEERARKNRIIHRLLEHGADVNAAPADWCGRTALQIAATEGELELVALLLDRGADINAPPCRRQGWVALDGSAYKGRLDVVKLLLNAGARSGFGGLTGYDGAIECARHCGHFAVAELIGAHSREIPSQAEL